MIWKLAWRNLLRNRWRSLLTAGGVAVAVGLMVWTMAYMGGFFDTMVRGATALDTGQALVERTDYADEPSIHLAFDVDDELLEEVEKSQGVTAASPRVNLFGLIGDEERSQVAQVRGVDPEREARATPIRDGLTEGRWLSEEAEEPPAPREVVLGNKLARQLQVGVGDELVVFLEASDGSLGNDLLEVVGLVETGNSAIDRQAAYVHLEDAQYIAALDGQAHQILTRADDPGAADALADRLDGRLGDVGADAYEIAANSWREARPQIAQMVDISDSSNIVMFVILYLLASLGLLNTQRMSALERRREFAVMMAIGVTPPRLFSVVMAETILLSFGGAMLGAAGGGAVSWYHANFGLDLSAFSTNTDFTYMGVSFSERLYFSFGPEIIVEPLVVMLGVAVLCGLWPALKSVGLEIAPTISGRQ